MESAWPGGVPTLARSWYFLASLSDSKQFSNDDSKWFDHPEDFVGLKVISNKSVDFDDLKIFNGSQVFHDPKGILIGSMRFDNQ